MTLVASDRSAQELDWKHVLRVLARQEFCLLQRTRAQPSLNSESVSIEFAADGTRRGVHGRLRRRVAHKSVTIYGRSGEQCYI